MPERTWTVSELVDEFIPPGERQSFEEECRRLSGRPGEPEAKDGASGALRKEIPLAVLAAILETMRREGFGPDLIEAFRFRFVGKFAEALATDGSGRAVRIRSVSLSDGELRIRWKIPG